MATGLNPGGTSEPSVVSPTFFHSTGTAFAGESVGLPVVNRLSALSVKLTGSYLIHAPSRNPAKSSFIHSDIEHVAKLHLPTF
jgi:hypothetical protein